MPQQGAQCREDDDDRQGAKGQDETVLRADRVIGRRPPAEETKYHGGALGSGRLQSQHQLIDDQQEVLQDGQFQEQHGQYQLRHHAADDQPQGKTAAVATGQPGQQYNGR